jgi:hypothetical protein
LFQRTGRHDIGVAGEREQLAVDAFVPRFTAQRFVTPPDAIVSHSKPIADNRSISRFWQCWSSGVTDARAMSCSERRRVPDMDSSHFQ